MHTPKKCCDWVDWMVGEQVLNLIIHILIMRVVYDLILALLQGLQVLFSLLELV